MAERGLYGEKPSKSADETRRREFAEVAAMSVRERIERALELGHGLESLFGRARPAGK